MRCDEVIHERKTEKGDAAESCLGEYFSRDVDCFLVTTSSASLKHFRQLEAEFFSLACSWPAGLVPTDSYRPSPYRADAYEGGQRWGRERGRRVLDRLGQHELVQRFQPREGARLPAL